MDEKLNEKIKALARFVGVEPEEVSMTAYDTYEAKNGEFLVLTVEEAEDALHFHDDFYIIRVR